MDNIMSEFTMSDVAPSAANIGDQAICVSAAIILLRQMHGTKLEPIAQELLCVSAGALLKLFMATEDEEVRKRGHAAYHGLLSYAHENFEIMEAQAVTRTIRLSNIQCGYEVPIPTDCPFEGGDR